jgi:hypothetical protein
LKKFIANNLFEKRVKLQGLNSFENMGEIGENGKFND